jgi:hypothetical protein
MKVKELVEKLQKLDQTMTVYAACEDADVVVPGYAARPFVIDDVSVTGVEMSRDSEGRPEIAAAAEGEGLPCAILDIRASF